MLFHLFILLLGCVKKQSIEYYYAYMQSVFLLFITQMFAPSFLIISVGMSVWLITRSYVSPKSPKYKQSKFTTDDKIVLTLFITFLILSYGLMFIGESI